MGERITANLPSRDFEETARFYEALGFTVDFRDKGWMIVSRGLLEIEFFPYAGLKPSESWFSACVRVDNADALHAAWRTAGLPERGIPRMTRPKDEPWGFRAFALVDPNGSLLRCMSPLPDSA